MRPCGIKRISRPGSVSFFLLIAFFSLLFVGGSWAEDTSKHVQELSSKDPVVRMEAARKLGEIKDAAAVSPLIGILKGDKDRDVRGSTQDALVNIGKPAVESLIVMLKDKDWHARRRAVQALGRIKDPGAIEPLVVAMRTDKDCYVRKFSARAIGEMNDIRAAEILLDALKSKELEVVMGAYRFFIRHGESGSESILMEALNNSWNRTMACEFLNCGNEKLEKAASDWGKKRAESGLPYYAATLSVDWKGPKWGENM